MGASNKNTVTRVLLVDDDLSFLEVSKKKIISIENNFEVDTATSVDEALKKLKQQPYDVVVSDYEMPRKNGLELIKILREKNNQIPFVLFTEKGTGDVAVKALNSGVDFFINKNGPPETVYCELADAICKTLERKKSRIDMTDRKENEKCPLESEAKFRVYVEASPIAVFVMNTECKFKYVNAAASKLLGYSAEELLDMGIPQTVFTEDLQIILEDFVTLQEKGKILVELRLKTKDNSAVYVSLNAVRLPDGKLIAFCENISERKEIEEQQKILERKVNDYSKHLKYLVDVRTVQLKEANERLVKSERLAAIGELAGMIGHDLRNPLTGIKNATYLLKKKDRISEVQAKEMLDTIDKCIRHSDKIINDLLEYSREIHLILTKYSARSLVDEALRMIEVPSRIQIINKVHEGAIIWVDPDKITRVFVNLVKNAIDAITENGIIEIKTNQTRDNVEIFFSDTGIGIPEETLKRLFAPLVTTKAQGMGFGLAICKRIIGVHGGTITVETAEKRGTTFKITLPTKPKIDVGCGKT